MTKYLVVSGLWENQPITSWLDIYLTYNRGVSWGIASSQDSTVFMAVTAVVAVVMVCFIIYAIHVKSNHFYSKQALCLIIAGGISNFIDRLWFGGVVDFIHVHYGSWSFPVFNVADIWISVGFIMLLYYDFLVSESR